MSSKKETGRVTAVTEDVRKADTKALITNGTDAFPEDTFTGQYWTGGSVGSGVAIIEPMFKPGVLHAMISQNNTLAQCVEAMEVNIDGTGHSIELITEGDSEDDTEKEMLSDFFSNPYPGKSMIEIRRAIRRDIESAGNGYMEVIRSADGEVALINSIDCNDIRMIRFDDPVEVTKVIQRRGAELSVRIRTRERRYVQYVNGTKVYFKEFGASRDLDRLTGEWAAAGVLLPIEKRASEILHFSGNKEPKTPYGTPRWINQLPSVLGSRKAEEFNLEFFDGGGIPPVIVIVEGGTLGDEVRRDLKNHLSGKGNKHRASIVEAVSTSGTIDSAGSVRVRVERFGAERQQDAMFQKYDSETSEHVRTSFRLPPMFLGKAQDYNFATAYTAYMVAEAQVFYPERDEFDSKINNTIVKALGAKKYKFRSLPLTLVDVENQLKALELAATAKAISGEELVSKLNEVTGLSMEHEEQEADPQEVQTLTTQPNTGDRGDPDNTQNPELAVKKEEMVPRLIKLSTEWSEAIGLQGEDCQSLYSETAKARILKEVGDLSPKDAKLFNELIASRCLKASASDLSGLSQLCGCANHLVEA